MIIVYYYNQAIIYRIHVVWLSRWQYGIKQINQELYNHFINISAMITKLELHYRPKFVGAALNIFKRRRSVTVIIVWYYSALRRAACTASRTLNDAQTGGKQVPAGQRVCPPHCSQFAFTLMHWINTVAAVGIRHAYFFRYNVFVTSVTNNKYKHSLHFKSKTVFLKTKPNYTIKPVLFLSVSSYSADIVLGISRI